MNKDDKLLSVEWDQDGEKIEIHTNRKGLNYFIDYMQKLLSREEHDHIHLMTPQWGGSELTERIQGETNKLINHIKIFLWD